MPIANTVVTLNAATPTLLATGKGSMDNVTAVVSDASAAVFLGGPNVTAANGTQLAVAPDRFVIDLPAVEALYAIASAATPTVRVLVTRQ